MKILVLQLTRFGDILCTLPTLNALRRERPESELHLVVRKKFSQAAEGCSSIDHLWCFDVQPILSVFVGGSGKVSDALIALDDFVRRLKAEKFDLVINLSFSPSSSFIAHLVAGQGIPVLGYSRTSDLYLNISDQPSRYFRAQVGIDKSNRLHVSDLMAWIAGVSLKENDWNGGQRYFLDIPDSPRRSGIVCHLGASQNQKVWPETSWIGFLRKLSSWYQGSITLVGTPNERSQAERIAGLADAPILNRVGETSFSELKDIVSSAELYVGADSGPMHVASLTNTPTLNISVGPVRFWETGPVTQGSRIVVGPKPELLGSDFVFKMTQEMIEKKQSHQGYIECTSSGSMRYHAYRQSLVRDDSWTLVEWLYFGGDRPHFGGDLQNALVQICEACDAANAQLDVYYKSPEKIEVIGILDRLDEILALFENHFPPLSPLLADFRTQKENIPPGNREEIFYQTKNCYTELLKRAERLVSLTSTRSQREENSLVVDGTR